MALQLGGLAGVSMVVNLCVTAGAHSLLGWSEEVAYGTALGCVWVLNFIALRFGIFKSKKASVLRQGALFLVCSLVFRGLEFAAWIPIKSWITDHGWNFLWANVVVSAVFTVIKYAFYGMTVFRPDRMDG